jgi:hypothetical protein
MAMPLFIGYSCFLSRYFEGCVSFITRKFLHLSGDDAQSLGHDSTQANALVSLKNVPKT